MKNCLFLTFFGQLWPAVCLHFPFFFRVDVSLDGGSHFTRADLIQRPIQQRRKNQWSWQFFEKTIPIPEDLQQRLKAGEKVDLVLTSKAFNSAWNVQPENVNYNAHGCCVNQWYKVPVTLDPKAKKDHKAADGDFGNKPSGGQFTKPFRHFDQTAAVKSNWDFGHRKKIDIFILSFISWLFFARKQFS